MKKLSLLFAAVCLLLAGCGTSTTDAATEHELPDNENIQMEAEQVSPDNAAQKDAPVVTVSPLPDTTMENLTDAILSVSLEKGDAYVDDTGKMQMEVKIFTYDKYDMVDISGLKDGDIIVTHAGEMKVRTLERNESGMVSINGGLEAGGLDLVTDECGVFYEVGFNDAKNWYEVGEAMIRVSVDFMGVDQADPELGDVILYPGSFLIDEIENYDFTPYNTTIRVENGQIIEMTRRYVP